MELIEKDISISDIKPGMFIKLDYTKADGSSGTYSVLVVDENRTNERAREAQLHAYNVDGVSDEDIVDFLFGLEYPVEVDIDDNEINLPVLSASDAYDLLEDITVINRPYRIFTLSSIGSIKKVTIELPSFVSEFVSKNFFIKSSTDKDLLLEALIEENYEEIGKLESKQKTLR